MQVKQQWFLDFVGQPNTQFTIPRYQRVYSWLTIQCEELWEDLMYCGREQISHFVSTTLYLDAGTTPHGLHKLDIIDGQQRIASTIILLTALRDYMRETGAILQGGPLANQTEEGEGIQCDLDADAVHERFLVVRDDAADSAATDPAAGASEMTKAWLIGPDRTTLSALVLGTPMPEHVSTRVRENYEYFAGRMREDGTDIQVLWRGLRELLVVASELDSADKPQPIFESLNTKGLPLTAADLMRNYLLVAETHEEQQRLYKEYWQPMEIMFRDDESSSGSLKLNTGLRMWLTIRCKRMCMTDRTRTFHYFKIYMDTQVNCTAEEILDEMRSFCYLWAENFKLNPGRNHCSKFAWAKKDQGNTIIPPMSRQADIMRMLRSTSREDRILSMQQKYGQNPSQASAPAEKVELQFQTTPAGIEMTKFGKWGGEPIEWRVLERTDESALLLAEKCLDTVPYHSTYVTITWDKCFLREWANSTFAAEAFSPAELEKVMVSTIHTADDELWDTVGGEDCEDRVFLLSVEEALRYFDDAPERMAEPTDFAREGKIFVEDGKCLWWLRSPGHYQGYASTVWPVGGVDTAGSGVGRPGVGFRPAIRVKL